MLVAERYRLGERLGQGGMGEVFRASDEVLGRDVALKLLLPTRRDPDATARFQREARAAATLSDPHVVTAYDFGPHDGGYFLVMELVEGRTVAEELRERGPFRADRALDVIRQAAAGLAAAHRQDIVHRDVKPGNLLLTPDGTVKITDFGIARFLTDTTTTLTATGQVLGTSFYLAPERATGQPAGKPSDIYALGCVLYQLVTGHPPFQGDQPASVMYQHVSTEPTAPSHLRPELSGPFEELLFSMLAKNPADRPTAQQIATGTTAQPVVTGELIPPAPLHPHRRRKLIGVAAALAVVAATTTGVVLETRGRELPETSNLTPATTDPSTPARPPAAKPSAKPTPVPTRPSTSTTTVSDDDDDQPVASTRVPKETDSAAAPAEDRPGKGKSKNAGKNADKGKGADKVAKSGKN
ncbi:serine/threonine protein kinase [Kribbella flavida DSM 17836]|uniref:non-specific serine/threonine protein kinase n=1 Tax=Kribbella flavida (strain DSM 17836 / JCM 10339 / NBRC 14399) TaxID=479435 RepID=D2Q495_KRIFD|nr:serine/threonine-protein kinase [Kribbella flavida]ADB30409.1 serine/threonine protein kinase [Kribbella flavida DSM 17836]